MHIAITRASKKLAVFSTDAARFLGAFSCSSVSHAPFATDSNDSSARTRGGMRGDYDDSRRTRGGMRGDYDDSGRTRGGMRRDYDDGDHQKGQEQGRFLRGLDFGAEAEPRRQFTQRRSSRRRTDDDGDVGGRGIDGNHSLRKNFNNNASYSSSQPIQQQSRMEKEAAIRDDDNEEEEEEDLEALLLQEPSNKSEDGNDDDATSEAAAAGEAEPLLHKLNLGAAAAAANDVQTKKSMAQPKIPPEAEPEMADEIFKKMKETGLIPNAVAMLDGLCKDGLVQEAMKLFGLMREKGTIPEVVIYTAVVEGFCRASRFDDAKRIFRKMQHNGIVPNAFSYAVLIQGLCKGGHLDDAVEFCVEMFEAGHSPNAATFVGLVDGFCKIKGVKEADMLVKSFQDRNFAIDEKSIREHLDKKGPFSPVVWEAIFGKKNSKRAF